MSRLHPEIGEWKGVLLMWQIVIQEILLYYSRQEKIKTKAKRKNKLCIYLIYKNFLALLLK